MKTNGLSPETMERRLAKFGSRIDDLMAKVEDLATWRGRLEGLHLQASLGIMELDDKLRPTIERLERSYAKARGYLDELSRDEMSWDEIEPRLTEAMKDLKRDFDKAGSEYRIA